MAPIASEMAVRPNSWLRQLTHLKPARWPVGRCVRTALAIALPVLLGMVLDSPATFLMMSLGALGLCLGERDSPYKPRFKEIFIVAPLGALGFFLGYLGELPWVVIVALMAVFAFLAGIISSLGSAFSAGTVQGLLMGCIAIAIPAIAPFWKPALFFLAGCGFYALLLGIEAMIFRKRPFINLVATLLDEISSLAAARAKGISPAEEAAHRRVITDKLSSAYVGLLSKRYRHQAGRSPYLDWEAAVLQSIDRLFAATLASKMPDNLAVASQRLHDIARLVRADRHVKVAESAKPVRDMLLPRAVSAFRHTYWNRSADRAMQALSVLEDNPRSPRASLLDRFVVAPQTIKGAAILALCIALAFATRWFNDDSHWYWTPLTVIIVLKPDLGSVFARTVLRILGTILGVVAGAVIFMLIPKGWLLVCVLALLAAALPWAVQRSYGLATFFATIIVLILLDAIAPGARNIDYGAARLVDTLMGGAIILIFGYFLWPRTHPDELARCFQDARGKLAAYLLALKPSRNASAVSDLPVARRDTYMALAKMRAQLQNAMQEPAPAGPEAAAWFPLVTSAERLCDDISAWAIKYSVGTGQQEAALDQLAAWVSGAAVAREDELLAAGTVAEDPFAHFAATVREWLAQIQRMTEPQVDRALT